MSYVAAALVSGSQLASADFQRGKVVGNKALALSFPRRRSIGTWRPPTKPTL